MWSILPLSRSTPSVRIWDRDDVVGRLSVEKMRSGRTTEEGRNPVRLDSHHDGMHSKSFLLQ